MQWYDADKLWPGPDARNIIIDGWTTMTLKSQYVFHKELLDPEDEIEPLVIGVKFFCLIRDPIPWCGDFQSNIDISGALFYEIDEYCCDKDDAHEKYQYSIELNKKNIDKFVDKDQLYASMDSTKRWAFIGQDK